MSLCYAQLSLPDRRRLHHLKERKVPVGEIARLLGRHRSTIYRELRRNTFQDAEFPEYSGYYCTIADDIAKERRRRLRKLRRHPDLRVFVIDRPQAHWSPEQIAGRLVADGVSPVRICPETTIILSGSEMVHMMRKRQAIHAFNPNHPLAEQFAILAT